MTNANDLLKELRIDRTAPPHEGVPRSAWIAGGVAAALLVLGVLGWWLFGRASAPKVRTAQAVAIGGAGASATSVLDATGYVVARRMATVSAKVTGKVREVLIEEGQEVEAGQVMATLDPVDAMAGRDLAAAQLAAARSQVAGAEARFQQANANARRLDALVDQQLVSRAQYDQAVAERDALRAQLVTARRNVDVAADQLAIADNSVDNTVVRAPFAGVVIAKAAQPGEMISPLSAGGGFTRTGIGTIVDMDSLEVEVDVGESYINRVTPGMPVVATLNAYPEWQIPAEVTAIIPAADRGKATVKVRIALKERDARIVPDMGVRVSFLEEAPAPGADAPPPGVLVPVEAIASRDGDDVAFVIQDLDDGKGTVDLREVQVGRSLGDDREVTSGLSGGDTVVLDPPDELQDGDEVRVAEDAAE
ncbi:MAG TPA: efflux RND transporter periplasmic adaptor subunit [Xanthomonadaceae bacterium]|nr:efflux RND transporter periplasmic adaptor subunit [Xanthomonadaceae bacterium]